ncbi:hypothetical protein VPH35_036599 [Triticum aestivum]
MANPSMAAGGGVPLAEGVRAVRAQIRNRFRVAPVDRVAVALAAASQSLRNREILDAVGTTAAALSTTDADGVQQGGQAAAADRRVVRAACGRRQAAAADRDGGGGLLARLLQRLRPLLLPRHRLQVCGDGLRSQGHRGSSGGSIRSRAAALARAYILLACSINCWHDSINRSAS